jgi:hygromycin-B 7''-O-kinase
MLPVVESWEASEPSSLDEAAVRPGADALCRHLGIDTRALSRFTVGSRPVYAAGELVLKMYPQADGNAWSVEARVLSAVDGALPVRAPRVHATGDWDGWSYLLMSRVPGVPLDVAWPDVPAPARAALAAQAGELLAALHRVPPPVMPGWYPDMAWPEWVARQRAACEQSQRGLGLAPEWADQVPGFLGSVTFPDEEPVLLHTEVMRQHLLVEPGPWRLAGLIDFEPAMCGAREYEFASVGAFFSEGDTGLLRQVLTSYGHRLDDGLPRRLLAWLLLHRYSCLPWYLGRLPGTPERTLDALASRWFGCLPARLSVH